jgi:hypothetical protein
MPLRRPLKDQIVGLFAAACESYTVSRAIKPGLAAGGSKFVRQTMPFELEAVYESGVLKLDHILPLDEH